MPRGRKALLAIVLVLVVVVAAVVVASIVYRPMLRTGTGYAAHNECALRYLVGRSDPETDLPPNPLVPYLRTSVDESAGTVTASVLGVAFTQRAHVSEYGCALGARAEGSSQSSPPPERLDLGTEGIRLPVADATTPAVEDALDEAATQDGTRSLVVVHNGQIIGERYTPGFGPDTRQLGWSIGKSVASTLVGRAQLEFPDADLDPSTTGLRPEWTDARADISLDDLLRMASGLEWDEEYDLGTPITAMLFDEPDMARFAASQRLAHDPGTYRQYSSGTTNIICDLLHERTGLGPEMASELLFRPLGMASAVLEADASGRSVCSSYLWATPRDLARFGQFALDDGRVNGRALLPEGWMDYSTTAVPAAGEPEPYGAQWWLNTGADGSGGAGGADDDNDTTVPRRMAMPADAFWASGHDGQYIVVVPSADLVVVRTGFSPSATMDSLEVDRLVDTIASAVR
ncbi:6-aminohexanoate-dimer hydrolase [Dietzia sp. NCCP-2495]|uniref:serine hydrolase domain-containing protein n=1 Tax=Dietzia sp. NCCP-2495 TaxID=2934675 RepID=UPI002231554E|nr:serine hydrolase [Dietzia sp. NCCP-2495]GLB62793.1 6-aminohexanoate-dimer hydrolase [Dietzia sp. NCCP-2495]